MTCIAALRTEAGVWIGADSAATGGSYQSIRADEKLFELDGRMLVGFTSSYRMGQLLRYKLRLPRRHPDDDLMQYMVADFAEAARECLKSGGYARTESGADSGGDFIVATEGRLFHVYSDFQVGEVVRDYDATGCGHALALGSFHATAPIVVGEVQGDDGITSQSVLPDIAPERRVRMALEAAAAHSAGVAPPFLIRFLAAPSPVPSNSAARVPFSARA